MESSSQHGFIKPASQNKLSDISNNRIVYITNFNTQSSVENFPDESCDTFCDTDTEEISMPGETRVVNGDNEKYPTSFMSALKNAVAINNHVSVNKSESIEPYHIPSSRYQNNNVTDLPPQKQLKNLLNEVKGTDYSQDEQMFDQLVGVPRIEIIEEPETTYRARYESEGCKGPIHGASENGYPTVKIVNYIGKVSLRVYVVTRDDEPHLHSATGPGSSKFPCKAVVLEDGTTQAIEMEMSPMHENDEMIAIFDQLSIRRVRNWEADKELRERGEDPGKWKVKKKEAKLCFQARISQSKTHPGFLLTAYSRPFLCTAPSGNPEIWWASLSESSPDGGDEIGFIGKKFASGFKVRFYSKEDDGDTWEAYADVDRGKSNLNACVVKVPPYKELVLTENVIVYIEIRVGSEKEPRCSDPYPFTYKAAKAPDPCQNCSDIKDLLQRIFGREGSSLDFQNLKDIKPIKHDAPLNTSLSQEKLTVNSILNYQQSPATSKHQSSLNVSDLLRLCKSSSVSTATSSSNSKALQTTNNVLYVPKIIATGPVISTVDPPVKKIILSPDNSHVLYRTDTFPKISQIVSPQPSLNTNGFAVNTINAFQPRLAVSATTLPSLQTATYISSNIMTSGTSQAAVPVNIGTPQPHLILPVTSQNNFLTNEQIPLNLMQNAGSGSNTRPLLAATSQTINGHLMANIKEEQISPVYHTFSIANQRGLSSQNSYIQGSQSFSPSNGFSEPSPIIQQRVALNPVRPQTVTIVQTVPTASSPQVLNMVPAVVPTPLEKEIQSLQDQVRNLQEQLALKKQTEYAVTQSLGDIKQNNSANQQQQQQQRQTINIVTQTQEPTVQITPAASFASLNAGNIQLIHQLQQPVPNATPDQTIRQDILQSVPQYVHQQQKNELSNQTFQLRTPANSTESPIVVSSADSLKSFTSTNQVPSVASYQIYPAQSAYQVQNNQIIIPKQQIDQQQQQQPTIAASNADYTQNAVNIQCQQNIAVNNDSPQTYQTNFNSKTNQQGDLSNQPGSSTPLGSQIAVSVEGNWDRQINANEAVASNSVGFKEDPIIKQSRPGSPMEVHNDGSNFLETLQQMNSGAPNFSSGPATPVHINSGPATPVHINNQTQMYNFDSNSQSLTSQLDNSFLDQNISVDYSDNFKKRQSSATNPNSSTWTYQDSNVNQVHYSQSIFPDENAQQDFFHSCCSTYLDVNK